jgi:hypothetical protein
MLRTINQFLKKVKIELNLNQVLELHQKILSCLIQNIKVLKNNLFKFKKFTKSMISDIKMEK